MSELTPPTCPRCGTLGHDLSSCKFPESFSLEKVTAWERVRSEECPHCEQTGEMFKEVRGRNRVLSMWCRLCGGRIPFAQG